jgi:hypothetical protein
VRGLAGSLTVTDSGVRDCSKWGLHLEDMDRVVLEDVVLAGHGEATRPDEDRPVFQGAWELASTLEGYGSGGALRAVDVAELSLDGVTVDDSWFRRAPLELEGGDWVVRDSELNLLAVPTVDGDRLSGEGPAIRMVGGSGALLRTRVLTDGQPLLAAVETPADLALDSVAWGGRGDGAELSGDPGPVLDLRAGGSLDAAHLTLIGADLGPAIRVGDDATIDVVNTLAWGHGAGEGLRIDGDATVDGDGIRFSMFEDADLVGEDLLPPETPDLDADLSPAVGSALRCAGEPGAGDALDLRGLPRPFEPGKAPDLGAVERQEACP